MTPRPASPDEAVILAAVRTPFGRRNGALRDMRPDELLAAVLRESLVRSGLPADRVGDVLAGCVSQAGEQGGNIARQAVLLAGLPAGGPEAPASTPSTPRRRPWPAATRISPSAAGSRA